MTGREENNDVRPNPLKDGPSAIPLANMSVADVPGLPLRPKIETFGKYRLIAEIGHGGMADVFLAVIADSIDAEKMQVIKRLRPSLSEDAELRAMLLDEARLSAQLRHKNIVETIEVGNVSGRHFIAMELLDGQPLNRIVRRCKSKGERLPLEVGIKILSEVLAGLHYAHEAKDADGEPLRVVHRDVSPPNVFVTYDGAVKLMDFGIAKAARRLVDTQTGIVRGKVAYMAPEQALPKTDNLDLRADIFSVGVMLWEELAGARMWAGKGDPEILLTVASQGAPGLPKRADIPEALARTCEKALSRDRNQRFASAWEMREELENYLAKAPAPVSLPNLGEHLLKLFADDRSRMQQIVERQLATLRAAQLSEESKRVDPSKPTRKSAARKQKSEASSVPNDDSDTSSAIRESSARHGSMVKNASQTKRGAPREGESPHLVRVVWGIAFGLLLFVGFVVVRRQQLFVSATGEVGSSESGTDGPASSAPRPAPSVSPDVSTTSEPGRRNENHVNVRIAASPPAAHISIDGVAVNGNPFEGTFNKDAALHRIVIEAYGFLPQGKMVAFDRDVQLTVVLKPKSGARFPALKPR